MKRSLLIIAVLTLLALGAVALLAGRSGTPGRTAEEGFLPAEIAARINDVDRVEIVAGGNRPVATLVRSGEYWQITQMDGYRADWPRLRDMLAIMAQAKVAEAKTDKPEYYARLGVEDVADEGAEGVLVRLHVGNQATGVIIGKEPQGRSGQYARLAGQAGSVQLDRAVDVPTDTLNWVDTAIVDVDSNDVAEVEVIHPDSARVLVTKASAEQSDFEMANLPEGRELKSNWAVNSLGSVLSLMDFEAVYPAGDMDWSNAVRLRVLTFSGMEIIAETIEHDGEYLLRLEASHPQAAVATEQLETEVKSPDAGNVEQQAREDVSQAVDEINRRVSGWVYAIAKYKHDAMVKRPEDLLKPLENS